jgi:hypothetical protein
MGGGRGSYNTVSQYNYVGPGSGAYEKEEVVTYSGWKLRPGCISALLVVTVAALAVFGVAWYVVATGRISLTHFAIPGFGKSAGTLAEAYDCNEDYSDCYDCMVKSWSTDKLAWCCKHEGRGCPTVPDQPQFNCNAGFRDWVRGWSDNKKDFCCKTASRGCA